VGELILSVGPARYLGGSIETFALPYGAFIVIAWALFYILRRPHDVPRLRYLRPAHQAALGTREPGTAGLISVAAAPSAAAPPATEPAEAEAQATAQAPAESAVPEATSETAEVSGAEHEGTAAEGETS